VGADLIVIGNHPSAKLCRVLRGSLRDEIVRTATRPVLLVHERASWPDAGPGPVLALAEGTSPSQRAVRFAARLARACALPLVLLSAGSESHAGAALVREVRLRGPVHPVDVTGLVSTDAWSRAIDRALDERRPGMIVAAAAPARGLRDLVSPSVVEHVLQETRVPVLIVPDRV
jgi:nucleotide-binding universal stress UspA family protein